MAMPDMFFRVYVEAEIDREELFERLIFSFPGALELRNSIQYKDSIIQVENNDLYSKEMDNGDKFWRNFRYEIYSFPLGAEGILMQSNLMEEIVLVVSAMGFECRSVSDF